MEPSFKPGTVVICVENCHSCIEEGQEYIVSDVDESSIRVVGIDVWYPVETFVVKSVQPEPTPVEVNKTQPQVIDNEMVCCFDVDDTLTFETDEDSPSTVKITSPYTGDEKLRKVHPEHIELMKTMKARGRYIVVWSGNGVKWARAVVEALDLLPYVDLIQTKPIAYVDDLPVEQWIGSRIYIKSKVTA